MIPLFLAFLLFCRLAGAAINPADAALLVEFYESLDEPGILDWSNPNCDQNEIVCDSNSNVIGLIVLFRSIRGTLPANWWQLSKLTSINLGSNYLFGTIPSEWSQMPFLQSLDLSLNELTGSLPGGFSSLGSLEILDVSFNSLSGTLPSEYSKLPSITNLRLFSNKFSGSLPPSWSDMNLLTELSIGEGKISGSIPTIWGSGFRSLKSLSLTIENIKGTIPSELSLLPSLSELSLSRNSIEGTIPTELANMKNLKILALNDNKLIGAIPFSTEELRNLTTLYLARNPLDCPVADYSVVSDNDYFASVDYCDNPPSTLNIGLIVGCSIGAAVILIAILVAPTFFKRRAKYQQLK